MSEHRPDSDMDDDKTAIRRAPNDDDTSARQDKTPPPDTEVSESDNADDATIIRGAEPSPTEDKPSSSDDATVLRDPLQEPGDDATILRDAGGSSGESTILRGNSSDDGSATILRGNTSGDSATILRGASSSDSATILRDPGGSQAASDDSTLLRDGNTPHDDDATISNASQDDDATVIGGGHKKADTTYVASAEGQTRSRGNSEAGRLLKNRFVLEEKVGSGGMGDVYKALDLRQQEAQERNPYIAIKILNESFARHKDAFISLQREATRTRGIPHPNIMAVYDFDREGDTVFMSMELLDGKPLDGYLKEHPEGVSIEDSWNIIDGICQGLSRAHGAGIVHSDFKPGNIYYTADKLAKVFDFGIARAVSSPGDLKADGEKTVFDAGSLGALTPTYASLEMLTGKEPTKSDDVYAVALVAYELFTGRHPYNRTPADKALERGLEPEPIPFLKRRHWRALKKGLALKGEDRFQSIDDFYEGMFSEDPPYFRYAAIATVLMISVGVGLYTYLKTDIQPKELTDLQGLKSAYVSNLSQRIGTDPLKEESKWNFESKEWRDEVQQSLARLRGVQIELQEKWNQPPDASVETWKNNVLTAYLAEVADIREKVRDIKVSGDLQTQEATASAALADLKRAESYLDIAKEYYNFDAGNISDEESRLAQAMQFREFQHNSIVADIKAEDERKAAAERARVASEEAAKAQEIRDTTYKQDLDEFRDILRCKGDISDANLARLNTVINGQRGLKATFPSQFLVDKPGIVAALKGCIVQRIGVRDPERARVVKSKVMTYLPGEPVLASIVIDDLDPCAARNLEGNGVRNGSWCSDRLAVGGSGPELVVIPPELGASDDGAIKQKFAISRIEVKVSDYNEFCESTGCKKAPGPGTIPVTNVSLDQAKAYAKWLSDETGRKYRLPTPKEWLYAAKTDIDEPVDDNVNCTVDSRGVRLGEKLLSSLSGRPNHWGLYNFVGNAREYAVASDDKIYALGGAHTDPKSECTVDRRVTVSGAGDAVTGIRLVRQIDGG